MKKHHTSRFPWHNRSRLQEEVAIDTYFSSVKGVDGSNCMQLYMGLLSRMINLYPMPSKSGEHVLLSYQDFMRYDGVPEYLYRNLAPEQKTD